MPGGIRSGGCSGWEIQLRQYARDVAVDGVFAEGELIGDLLIAHPVYPQARLKRCDNGDYLPPERLERRDLEYANGQQKQAEVSRPADRRLARVPLRADYDGVGVREHRDVPSLRQTLRPRRASGSTWLCAMTPLPRHRSEHSAAAPESSGGWGCGRVAGSGCRCRRQGPRCGAVAARRRAIPGRLREVLRRLGRVRASVPPGLGSVAVHVRRRGGVRRDTCPAGRPALSRGWRRPASRQG